MIELKGLTKSYVKGKKVIDHLNLQIKNGEIFGFLGPNGAGKTTTIKMMTGILNIDEGDILIDEKSIQKDSIQAKRNFGFVPDNPDIFLKLTGMEYLNFLGDVYQVPFEIRKNRIENLSKRFELYPVLYDKIQSYSHGMRQKIVDIGSLLHDPQNWILDEPLTGLDPKSSFELKKIMREEANRGKTVFFSTHVLEVAEKLCDRVGIINKGKIVYIGNAEEIRQKISLEELFMEVTEESDK